MRGATTGLRCFEKSFPTEKEARIMRNKILSFIKNQEREFKNKTGVILSVKTCVQEDKHFDNNDSIYLCYWNVGDIIKKTEETIK